MLEKAISLLSMIFFIGDVSAFLCIRVSMIVCYNFIVFIDIKAAFDTVCHTVLWNILQTLGAPPKIVSLFSLLYGNAESCVCVNSKDSDWFSISSGVH